MLTRFLERVKIGGCRAAATPPTRWDNAATMLAAYRPVLAVPAVRRAVLLGFLVRMPMFTVGVLVTVHIVTTLGRSYAAAGVAASVLLAAISLGAPWRGRLLDRLGLRRVVGPATLVQVGVAATAPFVPYAGLLVVLAVSGLFVVPGHALIRQSLITAVPAGQRRTALSLDGMLLELSAAIGPGIALAIATATSTRWTLLVVLLCGVLAGALLWWQDLPIHAEEAPAEPFARSAWLGRRFLAILLACATATVILSATDLGIVAALREHGRPALIGIAFAAWSLGSLVGGLIYGARGEALPLAGLLAALALVTALPAAAPGPWTFVGAVALAGVCCQPVITAGVEAVTAVVPDRARGEALGWHATSMTGGSALGAPAAGMVIDQTGARGAFLGVAALGLVVALGGSGLLARRR
jgi:MFS family permease